MYETVTAGGCEHPGPALSVPIAGLKGDWFNRLRCWMVKHCITEKL